MTNGACELCRFATELGSVGSDFLRCRRFPPQIIVTQDGGPSRRGHLAVFPVVLKTWWCGEFKQKREAS